MGNKLFRMLLFSFVFFQGFNLIFVFGNIATNATYQVSKWQYLFAVVASFVFAALLLAKIAKKEQLLELIFNVKVENK